MAISFRLPTDFKLVRFLAIASLASTVFLIPMLFCFFIQRSWIVIIYTAIRLFFIILCISFSFTKVFYIFLINTKSVWFRVRRNSIVFDIINVLLFENFFRHCFCFAHFFHTFISFSKEGMALKEDSIFSCLIFFIFWYLFVIVPIVTLLLNIYFPLRNVFGFEIKDIYILCLHYYLLL